MAFHGRFFVSLGIIGVCGNTRTGILFGFVLGPFNREGSVLFLASIQSCVLSKGVVALENFGWCVIAKLTMCDFEQKHDSRCNKHTLWFYRADTLCSQLF